MSANIVVPEVGESIVDARVAKWLRKEGEAGQRKITQTARYMTLGIALIFEVFTAYMIRDNLALNILMLVAPIEAVKDWQAAGTGYYLTGK